MLYISLIGWEPLLLIVGWLDQVSDWFIYRKIIYIYIGLLVWDQMIWNWMFGIDLFVNKLTWNLTKSLLDQWYVHKLIRYALAYVLSRINLIRGRVQSFKYTDMTGGRPEDYMLKRPNVSNRNSFAAVSVIHSVPPSVSRFFFHLPIWSKVRIHLIIYLCRFMDISYPPLPRA